MHFKYNLAKTKEEIKEYSNIIGLLDDYDISPEVSNIYQNLFTFTMNNVEIKLVFSVVNFKTLYNRGLVLECNEYHFGFTKFELEHINSLVDQLGYFNHYLIRKYILNIYDDRIKNASGFVPESRTTHIMTAGDIRVELSYIHRKVKKKTLYINTTASVIRKRKEYDSNIQSKKIIGTGSIDNMKNMLLCLGKLELNLCMINMLDDTIFKICVSGSEEKRHKAYRYLIRYGFIEDNNKQYNMYTYEVDGKLLEKIGFYKGGM